MDDIFKALSDPQRRHVLDLLREKDGQTLSELELAFPSLTRFGVMKHLKVLEEASLVATRKEGRFKYHYLNPVPLQTIADRWISSFAAPWAQGMSQLKWELEKGYAMTAKPKHVYTTIIRTTPAALWDALTNPERTPLYYYGSKVNNGGAKGAHFNYHAPDGSGEWITGKVLEMDAPRRLVTSFQGSWSPDMAGDAASRVTFEIEQQGEFCKLTLVHDEFDSETATYHAVGGGWPGILSGLKTLLETGKPLGYNPMAA
ncbi:MAG: SRPBCC domain-containing protein [Hyphomicrobiales bacterium]|nr:SRPBCC domain-containing protein [Hyphomicrobiales bacterium]